MSETATPPTKRQGDATPTPPASRARADARPPERVAFDIARARKEAALADKHELNFKIKNRQYVARSDVRDAQAELLAMIEPPLRRLHGDIGRVLGLPREVVDMIEREISAQLAALRAGMVRFVDGPAPPDRGG